MRGVRQMVWCRDSTNDFYKWAFLNKITHTTGTGQDQGFFFLI